MDDPGQGLNVDTKGINGQAKIVDDVGTDLRRSASEITALTIGSSGSRGERGLDHSGPAAVFGGMVTEGVTLGTKYNQLIAELALLGTTLGESLQQSAGSLESASANYRATDDTIAGA
jgi:hypothetical protein